MVQPCIRFKEEPSQYSMGQTAQSLTCSIMEKRQTGLDGCPRILLSCFRARNSALQPSAITRPASQMFQWKRTKPQISPADFSFPPKVNSLFSGRSQVARKESILTHDIFLLCPPRALAHVHKRHGVQSCIKTVLLSFENHSQNVPLQCLSDIMNITL